LFSKQENPTYSLFQTPTFWQLKWKDKWRICDDLNICIYSFLLASSLVRSRTTTQKKKTIFFFTVPFNLPYLYSNRSRPYQLTMFLQNATSLFLFCLFYYNHTTCENCCKMEISKTNENETIFRMNLGIIFPN
jgi:hypothetical protein